MSKSSKSSFALMFAFVLTCRASGRIILNKKKGAETMPVNDEYAAKRALLRERIGELPGPRVWTAKELADFLRVKVSTIWDRTRKNGIDPPPRCKTRKLTFDTQSVEFLMWLAKWMGIDVSDIEDKQR